jgi:hypothetical protein
MAKTSVYGYTNTTPSGTVTVVPTKLAVLDNYATMSDTANSVELTNKTAPIDVEELISYRSRDISEVKSALNIQYPSPVKTGVEYGVKMECTLSTTDSNDASFRVDEPIVMTLAIKHPKSGNITNTHITTAFNRLVSSLIREDGTYRFDDLMRGAEVPVAN